MRDVEIVLFATYLSHKDAMNITTVNDGILVGKVAIPCLSSCIFISSSLFVIYSYKLDNMYITLIEIDIIKYIFRRYIYY